MKQKLLRKSDNNLVVMYFIWFGDLTMIADLGQFINQ